jgi:hypothetical protein
MTAAEIATIGPEPSQDSVEEILELMANVPAYMEDVDSLRDISLKSTIFARAQTLIKHGNQLITEFSDWQEQQRLSHGDLYWEEASSFRSQRCFATTEHDFCLSKRLGFPNIATAYSQMLYWTSLLLIISNQWTTCIWLKSTLGPEFRFLSSTVEEFSVGTNTAICTNGYSCAINIAKS